MKKYVIWLDSEIAKIFALNVSGIEKSSLKDITFYEFQVLDYLKTVNKVVSISRISKAIDKSFQTTKSTLDKLNEKGLVKQDIEATRQLKKDIFGLSEKGDKLITRILLLLQNLMERNSN